jgi:hypothetical protein
MKSLLFFSSHFQTVSLVSKERQEKETETTMTLIFLTIALLGAASVRATDVLESIGFATYTGAGLSSTGANGALNSSLWRVDLVQDTNNDNTYGTNKTSAQASELGRGLVQANGQFSGGIGAVQINATTRALFLQPTSAFFTPGFVEFRTKFSSNTSANSLLDVTVRFFFFFFFFSFFFFLVSPKLTSTLQVEIYFWHLNNAPRATNWKVGFYAGDVPAVDVDSTDDRIWTTPNVTSSSPVWTLSKVEFVFQTQYSTGDDFLFIRISPEDSSTTTTGERDTVAISAITVLASKATGSTTPSASTTTTTSTTTTSGGGTTTPTTTTGLTQPGDTTTSTTSSQQQETTSTTAGPVGSTSTGTTVLVTGSTSAGAVASMAALVATLATMAMAL